MLLQLSHLVYYSYIFFFTTFCFPGVSNYFISSLVYFSQCVKLTFPCNATYQVFRQFLLGSLPHGLTFGLCWLPAACCTAVLLRFPFIIGIPFGSIPCIRSLFLFFMSSQFIPSCCWSVYFINSLKRCIVGETF